MSHPSQVPPGFDRRLRRRSMLLAVVVTLLWSSSWILIRWALADSSVGPIGLAGLRYVLASTALVAVVLVRPSHRRAVADLPLRTLKRLFALGVLLYALTQGAQFVAIAHQPAATSSMVLAWTPLLVVAASARVLGEIPVRVQYAGSALVAVGAFLYFLGDLGGTAIGMTAAVVALVANSGAVLLGRDINRDGDLPAVVITALSMFVGSVILLGVALAVEGIPRLSAGTWLIVIWLALVNTAMAFTWWMSSQRGLTAAESAGINNTMLVQIAVLAWVFLREAPGGMGAIGIVLVSVGIMMIQRIRLRVPLVLSGDR